MSLQPSIPRADLPPPSFAAMSRAIGSHAARERRRVAAQRLAAEVAEARALGVAVVVKPTVDRTWSKAEDGVVRALYPDYVRMAERLPHRSRKALETRASHLGLIPRQKRWTPAEVATLCRLWTKATPAELAAALPRWDARAIDHKARVLRLKPRRQAPLRLTGDPLCDAIRDRCRTLGISMAELDRLATSGTYFAGREWRGKAGHRPTPMIRAVRALGGVLNVEWPD